MPQETEQYQGIERNQSFVRKFDDRLWAYCVHRFKRRWAGKTRAIPVGVRHEGDLGWWFPAAWIADFTDEHGGLLKTDRPMRSIPERVAYTERTLDRFRSKHVAQISTREAESWSLPVGSTVSPDGVTYPDGSFETIVDARLRKGTYRPGQGNRNAAQQNLEDMLRVLHSRKDEAGGITRELAENPLTKRDWNPADREEVAA